MHSEGGFLIGPRFNFHLFFEPNVLEFVRFILQHGANANEPWSVDEPHWSIWGVLLVTLYNDLRDVTHQLSDEKLQLRADYMRAFLKFGADTEAEFNVPYPIDTGANDHYLISAERVIARFEDLEVEGIDEVRYLFEKHHASRWKNTEPTYYREPWPDSDAKRKNYPGKQPRDIMRKRAKTHCHDRYQRG